jgi:hypothetical protein
MFFALHLLGWPARPMLPPGVEQRQALMPPGGPGAVFAFARGEEALVKRVARRVATGRHAGAQGPPGAPRRAPAPARALPPPGPPGAMARCHAAPCRARLACARPPRGACPPPRGGPHGPQALGTLPPRVVGPPPRAGPPPRRAVVGQGGAVGLAPRPGGRAGRREARTRPRQALRCRGPPAEPGRAAPPQGTPRWRRAAGAASGGARRPQAPARVPPTPRSGPLARWRARPPGRAAG